MKSFTSNFVFRDVVNGPGWTDEYSQKHSIGEDSANNSSIKDNKTAPKA